MDETRNILKIFGVTVTQFETKAVELQAVAAQLSSNSDKEQIANLLKDLAELCREVNTRWLQTTQHVFAAQERLLSGCADAVARIQ